MRRGIKLIAFDLDGTLLTTDKKVTQETQRVLKMAAGRGNLPAPRYRTSLDRYPGGAAGIGRSGVRDHGKWGKDRGDKERKTVWEKLVSVETARNVLDIFGEYDTLREIYYDGKGYVKTAELEKGSHYIPDPVMEKSTSGHTVTVLDLVEKFEEENRGVDKVQAFFASDEEKKEAFEKVRRLGGVEVTGALPYNIEVNAEGINKGEALLWVAERLGIRREETLAFGDGANDVELLRTAGIGAAMSNGVPEVLAAADIKAGNNDEDGVACTIRRYLEGNMKDN